MRTLLLLCIIVHFYGAQSIRVCKTAIDYVTGKNCYENKDDTRNITEVISSRGYNVEEHFLTTDDGYEILVERLYSKVTKTNPVLIGHGIMMNGEGFVSQGNKSLGFVLANAGYDVWLISFRGLKYSNKGKIPNSEYRYWNFTFHEMAIYDFKAVLNLVSTTTNQKVIYMGYSMGTHVGFAYGSLFPQETEEKIAGLMMLSPVAYYINAKTFAQFLRPFLPLLTFIDKFVFHGHIFDFLPKTLKFCTLGGVVTMNICHGLAGIIFGFDYQQIDYETYPLFFQKVPDTICLKNLEHELQIGKSVRFAQYDYGTSLNMEYYNQPDPPLYNLTNIPVPVSMWLGLNDWISTVESAEKTQSQLQPKNRCKINIISLKSWMHLDILEAKDVIPLFFNNLLNEAEKIAEDVGVEPITNHSVLFPEIFAEIRDMPGIKLRVRQKTILAILKLRH
ncbi:unnamed protein product [Brassicogethes aeneus]|uniref:Lipase n=1 Tax=Brassicogethes aeneus TaxID=1431903 RepID=A0A9P0FFY8_BRAAE|nr:unnamed protein product [Brassicogethes aeneus]